MHTGMRCQHSRGVQHGAGRHLFSGDLFAIEESHCHGGAVDRWEPGTVGSFHEVIIARHGAYAREMSRGVVLAHPGVATFGNPGEPYRISHPVPGGDVTSIFRLTPEGVAAMLGQDDAEDQRHRPRFPVDDLSIDGRVYLAHQLAVRAATLSNPDHALIRLTVEERTMSFLHAIGAAAAAQQSGKGARMTREATNRRAREYVMRVREVIANRFHEPLTLSAVAKAVGCSPYHLSRIVTAHEGAPIYRLIVRHRLRHALEWVLGTRDSLSAIALDAGFASQSHFGDSFRREFGCAPGAARRHARCA
jgi:AraC family transcriptional regulator